MEEATDQSVRPLLAERIGGRTFGMNDAVYKFEKIKRAKREALALRPNVELIDMGVGEPDEKAPDDVINALGLEAEKWENRTYTDNGIDEFRAAVQGYMKSLYGIQLDKDHQICHSIGSKSALAMLPACFVNPGDVTILTTPGYPVLGTWTKYHGGEVVHLPLTPENNFFPELHTLPSDVRRRAKLLYLNYPNNPTGAAATVDQFRTAVEFATENQILIVSDAAYASLTFTGTPLSILSIPGAMETAIELHSMSKGFNMTGWRLGWVCGNPLAVDAFAHVKDNSDSGQFAAIQLAARLALQNYERFTPKITEKYLRRIQALHAILTNLGVRAFMPGGSFFLYAQIPKAIKNGRSFENAEDFSQWLIRELSISTVPWDDAGHFVRFSATFNASSKEEETRVLTELDNRLRQVEFVA